MEQSEGIVTSIFVAERGGANLVEVAKIKAVAGEGLKGDRYATNCGTWSDYPDQSGREVTLISEETLAAAGEELGVRLAPGIHRRNLVVRGVGDLQEFVGRRFMVGNALLEGVRPCLPCGHMEKLSGVAGIKNALNRHGLGGLRARIIESGEISVGAAVTAMAGEL